ncbi:MAG TPA: hypothetical protein VFG74_11620, partial [Miltoncostaeaceae bacterium]|nr:hypothetical protein [Miltoncostaeaceae bacterium]
EAPPPPDEPPPAAEEPPPPPVSAEPAPADLAHFERLWSQVLDVMEREAPSTRGFLDGSRPTRVDESSLEVTVTSPMRASMLGTRDNRERVRVAVTSVAGRTMDVAFVAGAPDAGQDEDPGSEAPPLDDEALLEEFKAMFRAVEEGG